MFKTNTKITSNLTSLYSLVNSHGETHFTLNLILKFRIIRPINPYASNCTCQTFYLGRLTSIYPNIYESVPLMLIDFKGYYTLYTTLQNFPHPAQHSYWACTQTPPPSHRHQHMCLAQRPAALVIVPFSLFFPMTFQAL